MYYICIDVGGTAIKYALLNHQETVIEHGETPTLKRSKEEFFKSLTKIIQSYEEKFSIQGIGISFPGHIVPETGHALQAGAIEVLNNENIIGLLNEAGVSQRIVIENDAKCAALAEAYSGNARDCQDFCLLTIGTGVGGAIVRDKKVLHGHGYKAAELGMMIVDFGENGFQNLHGLASTSALVQAYKKLKCLDESTVVHGKCVFDDSSSEVQELLRKWANYIALAIFNTVCQNDPEKVLIGGGVSQDPRLLPLIQESLEKNPEWQIFKVPIETCYYHNMAGIMGAYYLVKEV
ncbi:ROK family protein [Streptococcus suis]|uniref:ROK family protein n=1 Tax=Streptococcus suis TaxID=1307 RepID=UPI00192211FA|nr:ROK family protein [Streptococcus suis]